MKARIWITAAVLLVLLSAMLNLFSACRSDEEKEGDVTTTSALPDEKLAAREKDNAFAYAVYQTYVEITSYHGQSAIVSVPATHGGLPVASVGQSAFMNNTVISRVSLPESVVNIAAMAFMGCSSLQNVTMPGILSDKEGNSVSSDYIIGEIVGRGSGSGSQTTYDGLVLDMVDIDKQIYTEQIERVFREEILRDFGIASAGESGTESEHESIEQLISDYEQQLGSYYEIVSTTGSELNLSLSADYLKMISTVRVTPSINRGLYIALALVLFLIIGCGGAVVIGRAEDIINYMLYTDKKTGLPNRDRLNIHIDGLAKSILPDDYTCVALRIDNLTEITSRYGYSVGDGILRDFSDIVSTMSDTEGFVGYNGVGSYIAFFEKCSERKAGVILCILAQQIGEYNRINPDYPIRYSAASETTTASGVYDVRELLRLAMAKLGRIEAERAGAAAGSDSENAAESAAEKSASDKDAVAEEGSGDGL